MSPVAASDQIEEYVVADAQRSSATEVALAFATYLALSLLIFGRGLVGALSTNFIGRQSDPSQMMWLMTWWPYAITHRINPFLTDLVWAPVGFNFALMTSIPLVAILAWPLTATIGLVPAYNIVMLLAPPTAAAATFVLCRRIARAMQPAFFGGLVFGFSAYMLGQMLGHLCLVMVFPIPLAAYVIVRGMEGGLGKGRFIAMFALAITSEFLIDIEYFAVMTVVGVFVLLLAMYFCDATMRKRLLAIIPGVVVAYAIAMIAVSPYLYYFFAYGTLKQPIYPSEKFSTDLLNFIVPTPVNLVGANSLVTALSSRFTGTIMERNGFIGMVLGAIAIDWVRRHWNTPQGKILGASLTILCIGTLGPFLQVGGFALLPMPWIAVLHMPLLEHALPNRMMLFVFLFLALVTALWFADATVRAKTKMVAAVSATLLMIPNPSASFWTSSIDTPEFFRGGEYTKYLSRNDIVLTMPFGVYGRSMQWQADCGMCFRNVGGWTGVDRFAVRRWPIVNWLLNSFDLPEPELQLKAFLANTGVTAIVMDDSNPLAPRWKDILGSLGIAPQIVAGVTIYRIAPGSLDEYRKLTGLEMEKRANAIRLAMLIDAAQRYVASGHDPVAISSNSLVEMGLLPHKWRQSPDVFADFHVLPGDGNGVFVALYGSPSGLRELIDVYGSDALTVFWPFPQEYPPHGIVRRVRNFLMPRFASQSDAEAMRFLGFTFDRDGLDRSAVHARNELGRLAATADLIVE